MFSCTPEELEFAKYLLNNGYNINKPNDTGCTPLKASTISGVLESDQFCVKNGRTLKDVNIYTGTTCLKNTLKYEQYRILLYLLFHGGDYREVWMLGMS